MNIKSDKGITLIALTVTIVILIILAYVGINTGIDITGTAKFGDVKTYMLLIKSKCEITANEVAIGNSEVALYGTKQEGGEYDGWYKLSQSDLNEFGVSQGEFYYKDNGEINDSKVKGARAKDGYYVNYETNDVAYEKGIESEGDMYYKLSDIQRAGK